MSALIFKKNNSRILFLEGKLIVNCQARFSILMIHIFTLFYSVEQFSVFISCLVLIFSFHEKLVLRLDFSYNQ